MTARPYQLDCRKAVLDAWAEGHRRVLVVKPTGSGKTITAGLIVEALASEGKRALFLAHREELLFQTLDKFNRAFGIQAQLEKANFRAKLSAKIVVASVQTMASRGDRWEPNAFDLVVVDEAHHVLADQYRRAVDLFPQAKVLGITATPHRGDQRDLGTFFDHVAFELGLFELIGEGYLVPIQVRSLPLAIDVSNVHSTRGDFDQPELGEVLDPYLDEIARLVSEHARDEFGLPRRTIAFLPLVKTSLKFVELCKDHGILAEHIDGESPDRKEILQRFAKGQIELLSNSALLTEGFDDVGIQCVLPLRLTRSQALYAQMIGRGTRPLAGTIDGLETAQERREAIAKSAKPDLLLFDFLWQHKRHRLCRPANLIARSDAEADAITDLVEKRSAMPAEVAQDLDLDLEALQSDAQKQREEALRRKLEQARKLKGHVLTADEFASEHGRTDLLDFSGRTAWELADVTPAQDALLRKAGIDPSSVRGFEHATRLLDIARFRERVKLASEAQRNIMRRLRWRSDDGLRTADQATAADAGKFFEFLNRNRRPRRPAPDLFTVNRHK